ncbi:hypothetical protein P280DRAFT_424534 [Massarina eburnea CBS 473.64]|uniref:1-alkyl-2-acetylglycerophosphocholine esterase n=1 Tax=Massarina eburnea CBS 473.64 TaxID=1395130 RepID=A0A6A6S6X4_9PLEO|nr:hypothetical protein P280DRAFT_424534 [Massarina eburnea CBS 473.64]
MYASTMLLACVAALSTLFQVASSITIPAPKPNGRNHVVAHERSYLVEAGRDDQYNPGHDRKLAISLFLPVLESQCTQYCDHAYMPDKTAKVSNLQFFGHEGAGMFEPLTFKSCCASSSPIDTKDMRVIVLEPGAGTSRLMYTQLGRQLASLDVAVVLIDHPGEASIVEFEQHVGVQAAESPTIANIQVTLDEFNINTRWDDVMLTALNTRRADIHFVLGHLYTPGSLQKIFPTFQFAGDASLKADTIEMVGHGLGGTTSTMMTVADQRFVWSINLSGTVLIPGMMQSTNAYSVFFGHEGHTRRKDENWMGAMKQKTFQGRATEWTYKQADVMDFSDLPLIKSLSEGSGKVKGTGANGVWAFHCTSCFVEAYVRDTLQSDSGQLTKCLRMCPNMRPSEV